MPDFKNLNPILINPDQQLPNLPSPSTPAPDNYASLPINTDLSGRDNGDPIFGKGPIVGKGLIPTVTANELYENRRYDVFARDIIDIEDQNANAQAWYTQAANGILKGTNLAGTTIAGSFGMLYGTISSMGTGRMADIWDNPIMQNLDKWNNEVDQNYLPNYYTNQEKNASWYSTDNWLTTNFLFDKLVKNAGFAVGAMVSGNIANGALKGIGAGVGMLAGEGAILAESSQAFKLFTPLLRNTSRAFSSGKNIEAAAILEKNISSIADLSARESAILNIAKTTNTIAGFQDKARRTAVALYSSAGEASFEALQTSNEFRNNLIQQYKDTHFGETPAGADLAQIDTISESVGKTAFFGNMALLSVTEYAQLPKLLGSSYAAEKQAANSLLGRVDDVMLKEGKYVAKEGATSAVGKIYERGKKIGNYVFDPKEAAQEIGQYALQVGTQNYFNKGYNGKEASAWTDGFLYGMVGTDKSGKGVGAFNSKEGIESGILGGITGGLMQTFGPQGQMARNKAAQYNTERFIQDLNNAPTFREAFKEKLQAVDRFVKIQQQQQGAIIDGNELEARDLNADLVHTYLAPRIKYGRFDMIMDEVSELRQSGMNNEGLSELKEEGLANINDTVESFQKRLTSFEASAKNVEQLYKSLNLRYAGETLKDEDGNPVLSPDGKQVKKYSPLIIDKMVYAASKIADYDIRIPQLAAKLLRANVPVQDIINDELTNDTSVSLAKALYNIDEQKSERIDTDLAKQELKDVVEISKRRQQFVNEYNDLKDNPQNYSYTGEKEELTPEGKKTRSTVPDMSDSQYFGKSRDKFKSDKRTYADLVSQYGEGEKSKYEVLQKIAESPYATVLEKQLALAFLNYTTKDSKIILGDRTLNRPGVSQRGSDAFSALSRINFEDNSADYEGGSLPVEHVLLHEIGHDLTTYALSDTNGQFYKELNPLFQFVKETFKNDPNKYAEAGLIKDGEYYAFKNIYEFATEALSNREFQRYLQTIPYKGTKTSTWQAFVNSLKTFFRRLFGTNNETLLEETVAVITNSIDETYKSVKEKNAAIEKEEQALLATKNEIDREQDKVELNSGEIATPAPVETTTAEEVVKDDESYLKSWKDFYISGTSESENDQNRANAPQHVKNARQFLNNVKNFKNVRNIGAILVTPNNQAALGLEGLTDLQFGRPTTVEDKINDVDTGFVAQVFVEHENGKTFFVDKDGNRIGEVGKQIDINQAIFQAMPTTDLYYNYTDPKTGQRVPRYRQGEKENLQAASNGWRQERANLFENSNGQYKVYQINVSRGLPIINKINGVYERNQVGGILIPENKISSQAGLIQINTAGFVSHKGKNISFKTKGLPILQYGDTLEILNNSKLGKDKANSLYQVIKALANDIKEKSVSGKPLDINVNYLTYLQNVLYLRKSAQTSGNQFFIDTNKRTISLGGVNYPIVDIENKEAEIVRQLTDTFHNINSKTVTDLSSKFYEYTGDTNAKGELVARVWKNYQSYLLSSKMPDGKTSRTSDNTPLTTKVAAPTESVPYSFMQKYATLIDYDLPLIKPAPVAKPVAAKPIVTPAGNTIGEYVMDGITKNTYQFASGPVEFTGTLDADGNIAVDLTVNDTITTAATNPDILNTVDTVLQSIDKYNEEDSDEQRVVTFVGDKLIAALKDVQNTEQVAEVVEETSTVEEEVSEIEGGEQILPGEKTDNIDVADTEFPQDDYMRKSTDVEEVMTDAELELLKEFQADKLPGVPLEMLEDLVDTFDGEKAFGVYVDGVAKFYKAGPRTVGYHELFHPIWQHFLSPDERIALEEEFRNKAGQFTDRASGKKINFADATDKQIEERYADDFGEFKVGKLPARSLSEAVRNFFRRIINFFKSFNSKPSLVKELFEAIDAGKYKEFTISESQKKGEPAYSRIPGITETQASEYAQDMFARAAQFIFGDNKKYIYDLQQITGAQIYSQIKQAYINEKKYEQLGEQRFNALFAQAKQLLRTIGVNFNEEDLVDINDENVTSVGYSQEAFTTDWKKTSPFAIKFVAATLPEVVPTNQQNATSLNLPQRAFSSVKGYKVANFSRVFATLLDKISNTTSIGRAVNKLVDLAKYDATYVRFFQRVGGDLDTGTVPFEQFKTEDWRLFINFYQAFTKQKPNALVQYVVGNEVYTAPANQFTITKQVEQNWFSQMRALAKTRNGLVRFNTETTTYQVNTDSPLFPKTLPKTPEEMINFLKDLGITFTIEDYLKLKSEPQSGEQTSQRQQFGDAVGEIYNYLPQAKDIGTLDGKTLKINKQVSKLSALQVKVDNPNQENTLIGVEGNKKQVYSDNNAPSVLENVFNDSQTIEDLKKARPELNDVFSTNSIVLKQGGLFFNDLGDRFKMIKVSYIEGKKSIDSNKGTTTSKLTEGQRFTQEINQNINGDYYILIPADGSTEWMMNLDNSISYKNVVGGRAMDEIHEIFRGYLDDDIALARDWKSRKSLENVGAKAKELRFFKEILEDNAPDVLAGLNEMIDDPATTNIEFEDYISKNIDAINEAVDKSLQDIVIGTKQILINTGEIVSAPKKNNDAENMYSYPGLDSGFALKEGIDKFKMTETQLNDVLMFVNSNYYINNIEFHKILFGDPYQFKIKNGQLDETKRVKSFLSPRRTTFDSPEYNTFLNDQNKVDGIELTPEDYGYHENKEYATTVTLKDVELDTNTYEGVNEADAFSYILDVAYREVKNKNGQWSENAEAWHQYQMALTRYSLSEKGEYKYSKDARGKALKAADENRLLEDAPEHVIDITKPIVSGSQFNQNEIKLVLDKTSQMPLYYSAVAGTNLEKLYIKMFNEKIDYAIMESGRKLGIEKTHSLYNQDGTFNNAPFAPDTQVLVPWSVNGIQVETAYEGGSEQTRGSQPTKIVTLDMFDNGEEVVEGAKEAFEEYNKALIDLDNNAYTELLSSFGVEDLGMGQFELLDPSIMAKTLENELFRRQLSNNAKDTIQLDENGEWRIPFEASPAYKQIKDIIYSMINKSLVSPKMNGGGYTQAAVTGWESSEKGRGIAIKEKDGYKELSIEEFNALPEDQKSKVVLTSDRLHFPTQEDPYLEVMLPNWMKKSLKGKLNNEADLIRELNKPQNQGILKGIAFRIPAQAMSSMNAVRVVGFLPDYMGKTVVVPSEITSQAGSDFDIDKLNMYLKSVYVDENGKLHAVDYKGSEKATKDFYGKVYDSTIKKSIDSISNNNEFRAQLLDVLNAFEDTDTVVSKEQRLFYKNHEDIINEIVSQADELDVLPSEYMTNQIDALAKKTEKLNANLLNQEMREKYIKKMYKKALENRYFDAFEKLITLPGNFKSLITPIGDAGLKKKAGELEKMRNSDETTIKNRMVNRNYLTKLRHAFLSGKRWIGIAAVNITGHALAQRMKLVMDIDKVANNLPNMDRFFLGDRVINLPHNTTNVDGKEYTSLSGTKTADGSDQFISNRLSGYATSVVDIAKDPYIMKIVKSDSAIGTFMFLERIGVGENTIWFMNQPIIIEYLNSLESKGSKFLYNTKNINATRAKFGLPKLGARNAKEEVFNVDSLKSNIETYYSNNNKMLSDVQNREQGAILKDFLKYSKMAEYSFKFTQATNYDTTKFKNSDVFHRKSTRTDVARDMNMFTSIDKLLNSSSIGNQKQLLDFAMKSVGSIIKLEQEKFVDITNKVLESFEKQDFIGDDDFSKIASKAKASFLDFIVQTKSGLNSRILELTTGDNSIAEQVAKAKVKYPGMKLLQDLVPESSKKVDGAQTIKLKVNLKEAYDENLYVEMMRELRELDAELYNNIVKVALLQGTYQSPVSINNIIPIEDYSKEIKPIIDALIDNADTEYFANGMFQKNNWKDEQIVPTITPRFTFQRDENFEEIEKIIGEDPFGNDVYEYQTDMFETVFDNAENDRTVLTLSPMFDMGNGANSDFVKVPRVFVNKRGQNVDLITGRTISSQAMKSMRMQGNTSLTDYYGYQKVKLMDGTPLLNWEGRYVYKLVNLLGDGNLVSEYYLDGRPSVLNNGTIKIDQEIADAKIIEYFGGDISEEIVSLPTEEEVISTEEPIVSEEEIISTEEIQPGKQLDLFEQEDNSWKEEDNNDSCVPF